MCADPLVGPADLDPHAGADSVGGRDVDGVEQRRGRAVEGHQGEGERPVEAAGPATGSGTQDQDVTVPTGETSTKSVVGCVGDRVVLRGRHDDRARPTCGRRRPRRRAGR